MRKALLLAVFAATPNLPASGQVVASWTGAAAGNYTTGGNWSGGVVPRNGVPPGTTYHAFIDAGQAQNSVVSLGGFSFVSLTNLSISAGDELSVATNSGLTLVNALTPSTFTNSGTLRLASDGFTQNLTINASTYSIDGGGTIVMQAGFLAGANNATLTNLNNTITGSGTLSGQLVFNNQGTIAPSGGAMRVLIGTGINPVTWTNSGTILCGPGTMILYSPTHNGILDNTGGTISVTIGNRLNIGENMTVFGGTITGDSAAVVEIGSPTFSTVSIGSISSSSRINVGIGATMNLIGDFQNDALIDVNAGNSFSVLRSGNVGTILLSGSGSVTLTSTSGTARINGNGPLHNLTNLISGRGEIGDGFLSVINDATISASTGTITLRPANNQAIGFVNNGTLIAQAGATLSMQSTGAGTFDGSLGTIQPEGVVRIAARTSAGLVSGSGEIIIEGASTVDATHVRAGTLSINASTLSIRSGNATQGTSKAVQFSNSGQFNLADGALVVDYDAVHPFAMIRGQIITGYAAGAWNGIGINSSSAAANPTTHGLGYAEASDVGFAGSFRGQNFTGDAVLVMFTLLGDANLDRTVDSLDFNRLTTAYGITASANWGQADFDYNGKVNTRDFNHLAGNFGQTLAGSLPGAAPGAMVPEPAALAAATSSALFLRRRRI